MHINTYTTITFLLDKFVCDGAGIGQVIKGWDVGVNGNYFKLNEFQI